MNALLATDHKRHGLAGWYHSIKIKSVGKEKEKEKLTEVEWNELSIRFGESCAKSRQDFFGASTSVHILVLLPAGFLGTV